jgi:hypothetical protein
MVVTAALAAAGSGTRVSVTQDLQLAGAAAQYGRGMISDVTAVLMRDFAANMQNQIDAGGQGAAAAGRRAAGGRAASGISVGMRAAMLALRRVFRRFFLPYRTSPS